MTCTESRGIHLSRWRLAGALIFGHLAAACAFTAAMLLVVAVTDRTTALPHTSGEWGSFAHDVAVAPLFVGIVSLWTTVGLLPASLLTSPLTYLAARELRIELPTAMAIGAGVGLTDVWIMLAVRGDIGPSSLPAPAGAPPVTLILPVCAAFAGMAYGAVVWRLCIRPRLDRCGGARWFRRLRKESLRTGRFVAHSTVINGSGSVDPTGKPE